MNNNVLIGGFMVAFGLYTLIARFIAPHHFSKLDTMKKHWGETKGTLVHFVAYTLAPLVAGGLILYSALFTS